MKKNIKKIYQIITTLLVVGIVIIAVLLTGVRVFGLTPYAVLSGSMAPTYPVGSLIYVEKATPEEVKVGDPITFVLNEDLVVATHRVVKIDTANQNFYTKGDANQDVDMAPVYFKNLLGKPLFHVPWLGYLSHFLSTTRGMTVGACGLIFVMLLLFFPDLLKLFEDKEKKMSKQEMDT